MALRIKSSYLQRHSVSTNLWSV